MCAVTGPALAWNFRPTATIAEYPRSPRLYSSDLTAYTPAGAVPPPPLHPVVPLHTRRTAYYHQILAHTALPRHTSSYRHTDTDWSYRPLRP